MNTLWFGAVLVLAALLAVIFFVIAPPVVRVARDRRSAPGVERVSALTKVTERTVSVIESASRGRRGLFDAEELALAGISLAPSAFILVTFAAGTVLALFGVVLGFGTLWSLLLAVVFALLAPLLAKILLVVRAGLRRAKFAEQLDDTLQLMAGNVRAGYGVVQAIDAVARDADEPTSEEFSRIVNQTRIGRDLTDALMDTAARMRSDDFTWAAQAIAINRETGHARGAHGGRDDDPGLGHQNFTRTTASIQRLPPIASSEATTIAMMPIGDCTIGAR